MPEVAELTGRQLDAAVAERVMGFPGAAVGGWGNLKGGDPRPYSTDIAAAWQVVEKLAELGHEVQIDFNDGDEYVKVDIGMWFGGDGMKAPEAVCRAALRVIDAP